MTEAEMVLADELQELLSYDDFRTGFTFDDVYHMIYHRKYKRRNGVLGYWHELKQIMYKEYLAEFHYYTNKNKVPF